MYSEILNLLQLPNILFYLGSKVWSFNWNNSFFISCLLKKYYEGLIYCFSSTEQQYINMKLERIESNRIRTVQNPSRKHQTGKSEVEALEIYNFLEKTWELQLYFLEQRKRKFPQRRIWYQQIWNSTRFWTRTYIALGDHHGSHCCAQLFSSHRRKGQDTQFNISNITRT